MKRTIITFFLVLAMVFVPVTRARAVDPATIMFVIGLTVDIISMIVSSQGGNNDSLHNTQGTLSSQLIGEVGDDTKYTVVTDAVVNSEVARRVRVKLHLSDGTTMTQESDSFFSTRHHDFKYDIEALYVGTDNVYADVELWKYRIFQMDWVYVTETTTAEESFTIGEPYEMDLTVSPGTYEVRHNETFSTELEYKVKTRKDGTASGYNVQYFSGVNLPNSGYLEGSWTRLDLFSSTHRDLPPPAIRGSGGPLLDGMMGGTPGSASWIVQLGKTPNHVQPVDFDLEHFKVEFKIPKENFNVTRDSDYILEETKPKETMTCNGGEVWEGEFDTIEVIYNPNVTGTWGGLLNDPTLVIDLNPPTPPDTSTTTYEVWNIMQGPGNPVETGVYTLGSPQLTLVPQMPAGFDTRHYSVLSDSPEKLILFDENREVHNLTAGTTPPEGAIECMITGVDLALYDNMFVGAFSAVTGYDTKPVALGTVDGAGQSMLPFLAPGVYQFAVYLVEPDPPEFPLPPDFADSFIMRTYAIGGIDTPTTVSVPPGPLTIPVGIGISPTDEVVPALDFIASSHEGDVVITKIDFTPEHKVVLYCDGPYANVQMSVDGNNWEWVRGKISGLPPSWTWTSWASIPDNLAWFRCKKE